MTPLGIKYCYFPSPRLPCLVICWVPLWTRKVWPCSSSSDADQWLTQNTARTARSEQATRARCPLQPPFNLQLLTIQCFSKKNDTPSEYELILSVGAAASDIEFHFNERLHLEIAESTVRNQSLAILILTSRKHTPIYFSRAISRLTQNTGSIRV